jgi:hypothetical protein
MLASVGAPVWRIGGPEFKSRRSAPTKLFPERPYGQATVDYKAPVRSARAEVISLRLYRRLAAPPALQQSTPDGGRIHEFEVW